MKETYSVSMRFYPHGLKYQTSLVKTFKVDAPKGKNKGTSHHKAITMAKQWAKENGHTRVDIFDVTYQ